LAAADSFFQDQVIDLGANLGPNVDLTFGYNLVASGAGGFGLDLTAGDPPVPEPSTWVMMGIGFAALGFTGYSRSKKHRLAIPAL
jgi:PEP-CTERM motif